MASALLIIRSRFQVTLKYVILQVPAQSEKWCSTIHYGTLKTKFGWIACLLKDW